ncbi:MAG: DUF59 domain-containing protein [Deltaproteobacteria bacterium]|nr:DUF59 domain-containing protein [Deltaproteobacteria bacterium]
MAGAPPDDPTLERLKRRRLGVLNSAPAETPAFVLDDPGLAPQDGPAAEEHLRAQVIEALRTVHDPEIPLNIHDLGLVYGIDVSARGEVHVRMTLTAPGCPVAGALVREVHDRTRAVPGVLRARTELVWDPPWTRERLSLEARLELGLL